MMKISNSVNAFKRNNSTHEQKIYLPYYST